MAAETKTEGVMVHLEPTYYELLVLKADAARMSLGPYLRSLLMEDLRSSGHLNEAIVYKVMGLAAAPVEEKAAA